MALKAGHKVVLFPATDVGFALNDGCLVPIADYIKEFDQCRVVKMGEPQRFCPSTTSVVEARVVIEPDGKKSAYFITKVVWYALRVIRQSSDGTFSVNLKLERFGLQRAQRAVEDSFSKDSRFIAQDFKILPDSLDPDEPMFPPAFLAMPECEGECKIGDKINGMNVIDLQHELWCGRVQLDRNNLQSTLKPGDVLAVRRIYIAVHMAVVVAVEPEVRLMHFTSLEGSKKSAYIQETGLERFLQAYDLGLWKLTHPNQRKPEDIVKRAKSFEGTALNGYNLRNNNCQHFALDCLAELRWSPQMYAMMESVAGGIGYLAKQIANQTIRITWQAASDTVMEQALSRTIRDPISGAIALGIDFIIQLGLTIRDYYYCSKGAMSKELFQHKAKIRWVRFAVVGACFAAGIALGVLTAGVGAFVFPILGSIVGSYISGKLTDQMESEYAARAKLAKEELSGSGETLLDWFQPDARNVFLSSTPTSVP